MVDEQEFNNSDLHESNRSYPAQPVMIKTKSSSGMHFSATDTYNLSLSNSSEGEDSQKQNEDDDEPTDPFVQNSP